METAIPPALKRVRNERRVTPLELDCDFAGSCAGSERGPAGSFLFDIVFTHLRGLVAVKIPIVGR